MNDVKNKFLVLFINKLVALFGSNDLANFNFLYKIILLVMPNTDLRIIQQKLWQWFCSYTIE